MQKIFTKLNEALASAKALLHASRHVAESDSAESDSVALQQHRMCAALESSGKERKCAICHFRPKFFAEIVSNTKKVSNFTFLIWTIQICK